MPDLLVTCSLQSSTGLDDDKFVNGFAISGVDDLTTPTLTGAVGACFNFYTELATGALVKMEYFLSDVIDNGAGAGLIGRVYDITGKLDGSPHGSPLKQFSATIDPPTNSPASLPSEVACAITIEGLGRAAAAVEVPDDTPPDLNPDRPKQQRTGRIYFGPVNTNAVELVSSVVRVSNAFRDTARLAVLDLYDNIEGNTGGAYGVWSRRNSAIYPLEAVSVDDAFDTIRSRGERASLRERSPRV